MAVSVELVRTLRDQTGAGIMECKEALEGSDGDLEKAATVLREKGLASASKRVGRDTNEGVIETYLHTGGRVGAMVELSCETDFVSRLPEFKELAHSLTMQIAAMGPPYLDHPDIPEGDPRNPEDICLLHQSFIKDESKTIQDLIKELAARVGENIRVRKFTRFALGD